MVMQIILIQVLMVLVIYGSDNVVTAAGGAADKGPVKLLMKVLMSLLVLMVLMGLQLILTVLQVPIVVRTVLLFLIVLLKVITVLLMGPM